VDRFNISASRMAPMPNLNPSRPGRRAFLKTLPAAAAAAVAGPGVASAGAPPADTAVSKEALACAETLTGVTFSEAEREGMTENIAANRDHYDALRHVAVDYDVDPAFLFKPFAKTPPPAGRATPGAPLHVDRPRVAARPADDDIAFLPVTGLAALIESRTISSAELTELYLARLARFGGKLECVVTLTADLARAQAADADREIRAGRYKGPLHGIPYGIKDLFATKDIRTTWGANPYKDQIARVDATAVTRMREAGAVLVAKLTSGELAIGDVWFGGKTRNPWDVSRGSSGSSAGPASATAAGLVGVAIGTETGGSIISPAHTCGVVGLRPTYGRISRYGVMTLRWTMDKVGPLARGVEDCAIVLNALYGPDNRDRTVADVPFVWNRDRPLSGLRIGIVEAEFEGTETRAAGADPARRAVLRRALDSLRAAGARLEPVRLPELPSASVYAVLNAEAGAAFDDLVRAGRVGELTGKGPNDRANQLRVSRFIPAVEYIRAQRVRALLGEQMEDVMAACDVFLTPSTSNSVTAANLTGHPGVTVNAGFASGLPVGLMATGRLYDEGTLLAFARGFESARGPIVERPRL
jgi:Asp-tRNA(Asn)/Glu-tRNA(Gln) amidotransferase A subunit family amidase